MNQSKSNQSNAQQKASCVAAIEHFFPLIEGRGGGQNSGVFVRGPVGSNTKTAAKFAKTFFCRPIGITLRKFVAKFRVGGG